MPGLSVMLATVLLFFTICCGESDGSNFSCPTWLFPSDDGCACGSDLGVVMMCSNETQEAQALWGFCLTSFENVSRPVVGRCLYAQNRQSTSGGLYVKVNPNISGQEDQLCSYLNRRGTLCGECKANHFVSPYSFDLMCHQCHKGLLINVIMYLTIAYGPLTIFLIAVLAFHITVSSPRTNAVVLICQIFSLPGNMRYIVQQSRNTNVMLFVKIIATMYGVWNLDFFRIVAPPICLPLNTIQVIALDYLVAGYPLLLLVCFYVLVSAHDKGYWVVLRLWRPFLSCSARMRQQWDLKSSIIDAFGSFLLLSYMKLLNTSVDLLITTELFDVHGSRVGHYLYYDATIEFMGPQHSLYAILALSVLTVGALFPLILLLYPMKWFQQCLNKCHMNRPGLRMFMECFQGNYRDVTDGGLECRYFSAVYPMFRIGGYVLYAITHSLMFFPLIVMVIVTLTAAIVVIRPYKIDLYNLVDALLIMTMVIYVSGFIVSSLPYDWDEVCPLVGHVISGIASLVPIVYFSVLLGMKIKRKFCLHLVCPKLCVWQKNAKEYEEVSESDKILDSLN